MSVARDKGKKVVIVRKKVVGHGGHHGGSWKVAYADFVTAMMAFFLVMWIVGMDDKAKESIQGYFSNPVGFKKGYGSGRSPVATGQLPINSARSMPLPIRYVERESLNAIRERLAVELAGQEVGQLGHVELELTEEGLRIEFAEDLAGHGTFASGSAEITPAFRRALAIVAREIAPLRNPLVIEGHTDATGLTGRTDGYSNWELSADRANAARRTLERLGIAADRVGAVRGYADRVPKIRDLPADPRNRRISLLVAFRADSLAAPPTVDATGAARPDLPAAAPSPVASP